jgi:hypothetical protein
MDSQPLEFDNFAGGFTDYYLGGPLVKCRRADNLLILKYGELGKLITRPGSTLYDVDDPQLPSGVQRIGTLKFFDDTLLAHSARSIYIQDPTWTEVVGPTSNKLFPSGVDTTHVVSLATWNHHLFVANEAYTKPAKLYFDGSDVLQLRTAGMPALASSPSATGSPAGTRAYLYRFAYEYTYVVGTVTFVDIGPTTEISIVNGNATTNITSIPVLANGATDNYETTVVKVGIYRTTDGGATFYKVATVTNGTTSYADTMSDATLQTQELLYTEGGVVDNDPPPRARLIHVVEDTGYYADIKEGTEIRRNRLRQSISGDIDSAPESFFVDVDEDIEGLSSARGTVVLLCSDSAYRVDGRFDELGRGGMVAQRISDTCSCVSSQSVVQTLDGVFWCGKDAVYFTDGFNVIKLNEDWDQTYADFVSSDTAKKRIYGKYDPRHRRIWWSVQEGSECDRSIVLDLNWGIRERASFTTASGDDNWAPTAIEFLDGSLIRGDRRGYIFQHSDSVYTDPNIDTSVTVDEWYHVPVIYDYESCALNFGTNKLRKWVTWINLQARNETNLSLQIYSINDDGRKIAALSPIRFRGDILWGDTSQLWGDENLIWNYTGMIEEQRRFPAKGLRCSYKQVRFTNAYAFVVTSDEVGTVTVDATLKTAQLTSLEDWVTGMEGYYIAFEGNYDTEFKITAISGDTITFEDIGGDAVDLTGAQFVIKGFPKNEALNLISYTLFYNYIGQTQDKFQKSEAGGLAE